MRVLIDADGCPVVGITVEVCKKLNVECIIFCDTSHEFHFPDATVITVSRGADSVDFALVNAIQNGDLVITQDYGLAAMCQARNCRIINQDGMEYTGDNINALLTFRHDSKKLRRAGVRMHGMKKRSATKNDSFKIKLTDILKEIIR